MFRIAHITDVHLGPLPRPHWRELLNKRALGYANWSLRRRVHAVNALDSLIADVEAQNADHIAVTGDLVNIAISGEFATGRAFLERMGTPEKVSFVPGNHDAYVRGASATAERMWGPYMHGDGDDGDEVTFPSLRRRGNVALIGLSSAVPTWPLSAAGRVGRTQSARLRELLASLDGENLFRVVMIHHPPNSMYTPRIRRLMDAREVADAILAGGADLVLHGHNHRFERTEISGHGRTIPVIGGPSCSESGRISEGGSGGYLIYDISQTKGHWHCRAQLRTPTNGGFETSWTSDIL